MNDVLLVTVLFGVGILILIIEIFIPSYGMLTLGGLGFLVAAVYKAYGISEPAGHGAVIAALVALPTLAYIAVKTFHRTRFGRLISPPNPVVSASEFAPHIEELRRHIGKTGHTITALRPVGTCTIDGQRVPCVAESGLIEPGIEVVAVRIRGQELEVRPRESA